VARGNRAALLELVNGEVRMSQIGGAELELRTHFIGELPGDHPMP
jgi:hypothetical protein